MARYEHAFEIYADPTYCISRLRMYFESYEWPEHKSTEVQTGGTNTVWRDLFGKRSVNTIRAIIKKRSLPFAWYGLGALIFLFLTLLTVGSFAVIWFIYYEGVRDDFLPYVEAQATPIDATGGSTHLQLRASHERLLSPVVEKIERQGL